MQGIRTKVSLLAFDKYIDPWSMLQVRNLEMRLYNSCTRKATYYYKERSALHKQYWKNLSTLTYCSTQGLET
jgi:hypothetical protein